MKTIELSGDVGFEITAENLKEQLGKSREAVRLKIDSYGGSVFEAVRLYNTIKDYAGKVTAELGAVAASAASFFPLAADRIEVRSNTTYMGHKAWSFAIGNSDDMTAEALILEGLDSIIAGVYSKKTGKDKKDILNDMKNEFWLFGGDDIVAAGYADAIVKEDGDEDAEPVEQPEAIARLQQVKQRLEASEAFTNEMKRAAKMIDVKDSVNEIISALPESYTTQEEKMTIRELVEKNPEAKAELDNLLASAKAEGKETGAKEEKERVSTLVSKVGGNVGPNLKKALVEGLDYTAYCVLDSESHRDAVKNAEPQDFGKFSPEANTPKETAPKPKANKDLDAWDELYKEAK